MAMVAAVAAMVAEAGSATSAAFFSPATAQQWTLRSSPRCASAASPTACAGCGQSAGGCWRAACRRTGAAGPRPPRPGGSRTPTLCTAYGKRGRPLALRSRRCAPTLSSRRHWAAAPRRRLLPAPTRGRTPTRWHASWWCTRASTAAAATRRG
ncbi:hypothetical protein BX661DRAFT_177788 [Kickxella alabastrina]|uniref:uncharacterized protein n=1 Tax=Kickxella alabastrina TaxID=61397 RepID=UPI002220A997|nr:uncharacterized protein BX661DRAFT_177788 [Kickxella alabastrina]KAI7833901.1 hypothetical protein BX661DRAFT_177788 [Kickxella alabastrina]